MGIVNKVTNLVALQSGRRPATLGIILNSLSTKTEVKIITYNPLTSKYNVVFSGFAYSIYKAASYYLYVHIFTFRPRDSIIYITI
jgi:hypothetical protein